MAERKFRLRGYSLEGFSPEADSAEDAPEGVTPQILSDLWHITKTWGQETTSGLAFTLPPVSVEIFDYSTREQEIYFFTVHKYGNEEPTTVPKDHIRIALENGLKVIWDNKLDAQEVREMIEELDRHASALGLIKDGTRILINPEPSE